jgi:hypothetical protein
VTRLAVSLLYNTCWYLVLVYPEYCLLILGINLVAMNYISKPKLNWSTFRIIVFLSFIGMLMDYSVMKFGLLSYEGKSIFPIQLANIWVLFVATIIFAFKDYLNKSFIALGIGALAPFSYILASKISAFEYSDSTVLSVAIHGLFWVLYMYVFCLIVQRLRSV